MRKTKNWWTLFKCFLLGHDPILEHGEYRCERCHCCMQYKDSEWAEMV